MEKEKSVEEIVEQINLMLDGEIHEKCLYYTYSTLKDNVAILEHALQAERQKREEMVEAERERVLRWAEQNNQYMSNDDMGDFAVIWSDLIKTLKDTK